MLMTSIGGSGGAVRSLICGTMLLAITAACQSLIGEDFRVSSACDPHDQRCAATSRNGAAGGSSDHGGTAGVSGHPVGGESGSGGKGGAASSQAGKPQAGHRGSDQNGALGAAGKSGGGSGGGNTLVAEEAGAGQGGADEGGAGGRAGGVGTAPGGTGGAGTGTETAGTLGAGATVDNGDSGGGIAIPSASCTLIWGNQLEMSNIENVAVSKTGDTLGLQVYATQTTSNLAAINWTYPEWVSWHGWTCFDVLPSPNRIAAATLSNAMPEVYVTTTDGRLYGRRQFGFGWGQWWQVQAPRLTPGVTDVYVLSVTGERDKVFAVDAGRVYEAIKLSDDPNDDYDPWTFLGESDAELVSAATAGGDTWVFEVTLEGSLRARRNPVGDGPWYTIADDEPLADVDCGRTADGRLVLYALERTGLLKKSIQAAPGDWSEWELVREPTTPPFKSIAVLNDDETDRWFAVDANGDVVSDSGETLNY